jgi:hypothetical protein
VFHNDSNEMTQKSFIRGERSFGNQVSVAAKSRKYNVRLLLNGLSVSHREERGYGMEQDSINFVFEKLFVKRVSKLFKCSLNKNFVN